MFGKNTNWETLKSIYEFESSRLSKPGSYRRNISEVLWTKNEILKGFPLISEKELDTLISDMLEKQELMKIAFPDHIEKYVTRVAETVRLLGHNYEYWTRGRQGIDSIRWLINEKKIPERLIPAEEFINQLTAAVFSEIPSSNSTLNLRNAIRLVVEGIGEYFVPKYWTKAKFSQFQLQAAIEMILAQFSLKYKPKSQILIAGVGSGKTVAFSIAMLASAVEGILSGEKSRRTHLFIYPRKALAQDQYKTLSKIAEKIGLEELTVHFEHHSYYESIHKTAKDGIAYVYDRPGCPPSIIITTFETLNRRLRNPLVIRKLSEYLSRVIIDEIHLVEGIPGCQIIKMMDRLQNCCYRKILWTGSSATVASPDVHAATIFNVNRDGLKIIEPPADQLKIAGLVHHVFMRPPGTMSNLGTLVNSTSILVHNRRNGFDVREEERERAPKTIGFADNLDILGRWNSDLRENERTEQSKNRKHPDDSAPGEWRYDRQREIPYALRFYKPLQRRAVAEEKSKAFEPIISNILTAENKLICEKCQRGQRISLGSLLHEDLKKLGKLIYREPVKDKDKAKLLLDNKKIFEAESSEIGTLDLCPYLQAGACFWFAKDDLLTQQISKEGPSIYEWRSVARSRVQSSKTSRKTQFEEDLSEIVFRSTLREVYDLYSEKTIPIDIVLASPSLEVGVDLQNVTESIMYKAIRNVASYRQKVGRIGREEGSNALNATLISFRPIDLHYYRQPRKIISQAHLDPIPLKEYNRSILECAMYLATWDYLALRTDLPEVVPKYVVPGKPTIFTEKLQSSYDYLLAQTQNLASHLSAVSRYKLSPQDPTISEVIEQIKDEIGIFLTETKGTIEDPRIHCISDMVVYFLNSHSSKVNPPKQSDMEDVKIGSHSYDDLRPRINPIRLGLSREFERLDLFASCGWVLLDEIKTIKERIDKKTAELEQNKEYRDESKILSKISDRALEDIISGLSDMKESGANPIVFYFYEQFDKFKKDHPSWPYYLSYTLQGMPIFKLKKRNTAFTTPQTLFINPYEPEVALFRKKELVETVSVNETLFSYIPGTWTFRQGKIPNKTLVGRLNSHDGVLYAKLREIELQGNEFKKIREKVPAPPGFPAENLVLYMPTKLTLSQVYGKHVYMNLHKQTVIDNDEDTACGKTETQSEETDNEDEYTEEFVLGQNRSKIPASSIERWVHIIANAGNPITVNKTNQEFLIIEGTKPKRQAEAVKSIQHPILTGIIDCVRWHEELNVFDYVCSVSRTYNNRIAGNATLLFEDDAGRNVAFGRCYLTEGFSIELNPKPIEQIAQKVKNEILNFNNKWAPSIIKAFQGMLTSIKLPNGQAVSPFLIKDLIAVMISCAPSVNTEKIIEFPAMLRTLLDEGRFKEAAESYYKNAFLRGLNEKEESKMMLSDKDKRDISTQVSKLYEFALSIVDSIPRIKETLDDWIVSTLLNTFGVSSLSALQQLCGSGEQDIGYSIDMESIKKGIYRVFLYDRTEHGNGSCETARKYLHILNIQRHGLSDESKLLPTEDFFTLLEQELLQCPQFHADLDALEKLEQIQTKKKPTGIPELAYISEYSDEILQVCKETWGKLGIKGRQDAWMLPLIAMAPASFAAAKGIEIDDIMRATSICWGGCPECVINTSSMIGFLGTAFVDKNLLDEWFKLARANVEEYKTLTADNIAAGTKQIEIGRQTRVCIELPNRKIRSSSLPFTIGFEIDRETKSDHATLLVRDSDIADRTVFDKKFDGCSHGLEALGSIRIMWYNLIMSAYLDMLNLLKTEQKEILLVFYDIRDVSFDDVGMSTRMMDAIEYFHKKSGLPGGLRTLSDILIWLGRRGFAVSLCIDEKQAKEEYVEAFLKKLSSQKIGNIKIGLKGLQGTMHKKALVCPIGALYGSANLTFSGTQHSEEMLNYAASGTDEYNQMKINVRDTFHGINLFTPKKK